MSLQCASDFIFVQNRQEEKKMRLKLQESVSMDERVVALQKTLELKQQARQKKKETEKAKSKLNEQMAAQNLKSYSHNKVSTYVKYNFSFDNSL